jgi:hypothetical protein
MRHRAIKTLLSLSLCALCLLLLRCSGNLLAGGVETTNGLTVVAAGLAVHGSAPIGSMVSLFPSSINPISKNSAAFIDSVLIDSGGTFSFERIGDSGNYNVVAINAVTRRGAMVSSLHIRPDGRDSIVVPFDTLGRISGFAVYVKNSDTLKLGFYDVYLAGSNFFTQTDSAGFYKISDIPMGKYRVILTVKASTITPVREYTIEQAAEVDDQNTTVLLNFFIE